MFLLILMMCFVLPSTIPISARFMLHVGVTRHYEQQSDLANNMAPNHPQQQCVKTKKNLKSTVTQIAHNFIRHLLYILWCLIKLTIVCVVTRIIVSDTCKKKETPSNKQDPTVRQQRRQPTTPPPQKKYSRTKRSANGTY
jgi:hypothetical protein